MPIFARNNAKSDIRVGEENDEHDPEKNWIVCTKWGQAGRKKSKNRR